MHIEMEMMLVWLRNWILILVLNGHIWLDVTLLDSAALNVQYNIIYYSLDFSQLGFHIFYLMCMTDFLKQIVKGNLYGILGIVCSLNPGIFLVL